MQTDRSRSPGETPDALQVPEEELRLSRERLALAIEASGAAVYDHAVPIARRAYHSARWANMLGYEPAELPPSEAFEDWLFAQVHPDDRSRLGAAYADFIEGRSAAYDVEVRLRHKAGRWIWVRGMSKAAARDDEGRVTHVVGLMLDVTAQKEREAELERFVRERTQALQLERRRLEAVLDQMPSGLSVAEAPSGRLILHNEKAVRLLRHPMLTSEDVEGYARYGAIHDDGTPYAPEEYPIARALLGETVDQEDMRYRRGDGTMTTFSVNAAPVRGEDGEILFAVSTFHDVARQRQTELEVRRMSVRLLQAQEEERRHLARELHDELGGLLTSLQMSLKMNPASREDARRELAESHALVETMVGKVRQLSLNLRPSLLDDLGLAPALRWFFERYSAQTRIEVDFHHELRHGERFSPAVETAVYRIIQEAATNVARHADTGRLQVLVHREDEALVLHVLDEGRGFDPEAVLARRETAGLFGMRERAALLGGRTTIRSQPGQGARITAEIPT